MDEDPDALYRTVRRAARDGVREALWDAVTVIIAAVLLLLGIPLVLTSAQGGLGLATLAGVAVGLVVSALGVYSLYDRFWRRLRNG